VRHVAWAAFAAAVLVLAILAGCGGSGGSGGFTGPRAATLHGRVNLGGNPPANYQVLLDGQPVNVPIAPDGSFTITGVPPGEHVVDIVRDDGMEGGRAPFVAEPGQPITIPEPIDLEGAGQIVGFVVKQDSPGGVETPLAGVEVTARSDVMWIMNGGTATLAPARAAQEPGTTEPPITEPPIDPPIEPPIIYPPPPAVSYTAVTGDDGRYEMIGVKPGGYLVTVAVPGFQAGAAYVWVSANRTTAYDFVLLPVVEPGVGTVEGTVTGEVEGGGSPVALKGAEVVVNFPYGGWQPTPVPLAVELAGARQANVGVDLSVPVMPPDIIYREFRTLTNADGKYSLNVPTGYGQIFVWALNYEPAYQELKVEDGVTITQDFLLRLWQTTIPPPDSGGGTEPGSGQGDSGTARPGFGG